PQSMRMLAGAPQRRQAALRPVKKGAMIITADNVLCGRWIVGPDGSGAGRYQADGEGRGSCVCIRGSAVNIASVADAQDENNPLCFAYFANNAIVAHPVSP